MITLRARFHPRLDKVAELRAFMTDSTKAAQARGEQVALAQRIYSSEGPTLVVRHLFEDLAAADGWRRKNLTDAAWQEQVAKVNALVRAPVQLSLEEIVVPIAPGDTPVGVVQRAFFYPAPEKIGEMRALLEEFVRTAQASGRPQVGLSQLIFSAVGPVQIITATYPDMADLDQARRDRAPVVQPLVAAAGAISREPIALRLLEVVVPLPR
jgi:hypothetical protein